MKKYFLLLAVLVAAVWSSSALALVVPPGFVGTYSSLAGYQTWASSTGNIATAGEAVFTAAAGGGLNAATKVAPLLADGRAVAMTVNRFASGAALFGALRVLTGNPVVISLALLEAMPAILDWIRGDAGVHVKIDPVTGGLYKIDSSVCTVSPCYEFQQANTSIWIGGDGQESALTLACKASASTASLPNPAFSQFFYSAVSPMYCKFNYYDNKGVFQFTSGNYVLQSRTVSASSASWLPASMDDIAPYMTPRSPPVAFPDQLINAGGSIPVSPVSLTVDAPLTAASPYVHTTTYPKPADQTTRVQTLGNPWGLSLNTPTVTASATSMKSLNAGSSTDSGTNTSGSPVMNPSTVMTPSTTTTTSTFDGTNTTSDTVTTQNGAQVQATTNTVTNIANTTNTSTVNITNTTTTTTTDTTTQQPLVPTKIDTNNKPLPESTADPCVAHPTRLGCTELGTATDAPLGALPKLYEAKYPTGLTGVWATQKAAMMSSPLFSLTSKLMPSLGSTGSCPSWMVDLDLGPWNYGSHDVAPPCWIWDFAKAIVILSALLLARALIFGG